MKMSILSSVLGILFMNTTSLAAESINTDGLTVRDSWFFKGKLGDQVRASNNISVPLIVKHGECFGFKAVFPPINERVEMHVKLTVPMSADRFKSHSGHYSVASDNKSIVVDDDINGNKGEITFFWGVDDGDPDGKYQLEFSLNGKKVASYQFAVR